MRESMDFKERLSEAVDGITVYDVLLAIAGVMLVCLASPYVVRQFEKLSGFGDYFWNICWDVFIFDAGVLALMLLARLIKVFVAWTKRNM